jgi:hypothetical protein
LIVSGSPEMNAPVLTSEMAVVDPREELAAAIKEHDAAEAAAAKAQAAIDRASLRLNAAEEAHELAVAALETARESQADRLVDAASTDRSAPANDALRKARQAKETADDDVVAARTALDKLRDLAKGPAYALSRARDRRQKAVNAVARPEICRLLAEAQDLVERLGAKRAELRFTSWNLLDSVNDAATRRQVDFFLGREPYPEENGLLTKNDPTRRNAAIAAWQKFAADIVKDAAAPVPVLD